MYDFFRRNNKKLMAFFGVFLMVAFLMPTFQTGQPGMVDRVVGTIGDAKIHQEQVRRASGEWDLVTTRVLFRPQGGAPQSQWQPLVMALIPGRAPDALAMAMSQNPTSYFLLLDEANRMGFTPDFEMADRILENPAVGIVSADKRILPFQDLPDAVTRKAIRTSVANLVMLSNAYQRSLSIVKVSDPLIKHEISQRLQKIKVRLVDFPAKDFESKVPAPTPEQLAEHFKQFAQIEVGAQPSDTNPFGFGYKYPNRVKLQYVAIPREEVRRAVKAQKDDYGWEVEGQRYYIEHQSEFPTTAPAATQESLALLPVPKQPTTKPFEEVRDTILARVTEPLIDRLQLQIQSEVSSRLVQDYHAYETAHGPSTLPATEPIGNPFESFEYLQKLAADIQSRHKVTLTIVAVADSFKSSVQLAELKDISKVTNFAELAVMYPEPFVAPEHRSQPGVLSLFEPSRAVTDEDRNIYFYRITSTDRTHSPASVEEVKTQVETDFKRAQAFELAKQEAQKLLEVAKGPGLDVAAPDKITLTGAYSADSFVPIDNYKLSTRAQSTFTRETYALMSMVGGGEGVRPIGVVAMPADERVAIAELVAIESGISPQISGIAQTFISSQILQQYEGALASGWFNYPSIVERTGFKDLLARTAPGEAAP